MSRAKRTGSAALLGGCGKEDTGTGSLSEGAAKIWRGRTESRSNAPKKKAALGGQGGLFQEKGDMSSTRLFFNTSFMPTPPKRSKYSFCLAHQHVTASNACCGPGAAIQLFILVAAAPRLPWCWGHFDQWDIGSRII